MPPPEEEEVADDEQEEEEEEEDHGDGKLRGLEGIEGRRVVSGWREGMRKQG